MFRIARTSNVNRVAFDPVAFNRMAFDRGEFKFRCAFEIPTELGDINRYIGNFKLNDSMLFTTKELVLFWFKKFIQKFCLGFEISKLSEKCKSPLVWVIDQGI